MPDRPRRVLFLCTGNSARSQMAEAILRSLSDGRVEACSAGISPQPTIHPMTRQVLEERFHIDTSRLAPKSVDQFVAQRFDHVITVCDEAAEACPVFSNADQQLHWNFADPARVPDGPRQQQAFEDVADGLARRIGQWLAQPDAVDA